MTTSLARLKQRLSSLKIRFPSAKNSWWTFVIAFAVFIFLGLSLRKDWKTILTYNWQIHWADLVIMALFHCLALGSMYLAWHFTMRRLVNQDHWRHNFRIFSVSMLARDSCPDLVCGQSCLPLPGNPGIHLDCAHCHCFGSCADCAERSPLLCLAAPLVCLYIPISLAGSGSDNRDNYTGFAYPTGLIY